MEGDNQAINSSNNQPTTTSDTTLMSTMTSVTHSVPSHIVDDFEPDPKCEITTLEKASYDCNEMEKVIDNIVDLGGCQQLVSDMDQQECTTNREQAVENIQREIIGDRIHSHAGQKPEHQSGQLCRNDVHREAEQQPAQQVEIPPQHQESPTNENTATTFEQTFVKEMQEKQAVSEKEALQTSPPEVKKLTDLTLQDSVPTTGKGLAEELNSENEPASAIEVPNTEMTVDVGDQATTDREPQIEELVDNTADQEQIKSVVEEVVSAENVVEESVEEEVVEGNPGESLDVTAEDRLVEGSTENHEQMETSTEQMASKVLEPTAEVNSVVDPVPEKIEHVETPFEAKPPAKKRGRKPKSETVIVPVPEVLIVERPRRTRGSLRPNAGQEEDHAAKEQPESGEMEKEKAEQIGAQSKEEEPRKMAKEKSSEVPQEEPPKVAEEISAVVDTSEQDHSNSKHPEFEAEPEVEPEKPVRSVRARVKRSFPEEPPQEPQEKKTVKKAKVEKNETPMGRGISNPKLKLPTRTRVTISTSRPATKPERRCDYDDFGFRKYRCDLCRFSTDRLNTIVEHQKNAVCEAAKRRYESHVQESLHKLQSPKGNKKRYSR